MNERTWLEDKCRISDALKMIPESTPDEIVKRIEYLWKNRAKSNKQIGLQQRKIRELEAENAQLLDALDAVEWLPVWDDILQRQAHRCPNCEALQSDGHTEDCKTGVALVAARGG